MKSVKRKAESGELDAFNHLLSTDIFCLVLSLEKKKMIVYFIIQSCGSNIKKVFLHVLLGHTSFCLI